MEFPSQVKHKTPIVPGHTGLPQGSHKAHNINVCEPEWSVSAYHPLLQTCYVIRFSFTFKKCHLAIETPTVSVRNKRHVQLWHVLSYY